MDELLDASNSCYYCKKYAEHIPSYILNGASLFLDSLTPRCYLHGQYICDVCRNPRHFNGVAWCHACKQFTCVRCSSERVIMKSFVIYGYHYQIECPSCHQYNNSLEYAEFEGTHPFQTGDIYPQFNLNVWFPLSQIAESELGDLESSVNNEIHSGRTRLHQIVHRRDSKDLSISSDGVLKDTPKVKKRGGGHLSPIEMWSRVAEQYHHRSKEGGDWHHREMILPSVLELLDPERGERILDVGCGEGHLSRTLYRMGAEVTGVDPSDMINYAIQCASDSGLHISYHKGKLHEVTLSEEKFDAAVANMVLMDMDDEGLEETLSSLSELLAPGGRFVFSILHPCFTPPVKKSLKFPFDSEKNTDKIFIIGNYLQERTTEIEIVPGFPTLHYHRTLSSYFNVMSRHGFRIVEVIEPRPSPAQIQKFPRETWNDYDQVPLFLVVKLIRG